MAENEYKEKEEPVIEGKTGKTAKKEARSKKSQSTSGKTSADFLSIFKLNVDEKKLNTTLGSTLLLLSLFLFLASFSYIFTWKEDQDQILNKGFFEYIFSSDDVPAENWLGKFGAWFSHLLIFKWFGLASFGIPFLLFLSAVKRLFNTTLLPIKPTYLRTISIMVWASMFLGFFADKVNYLGGSFGFYINDWLSITLGSFGAIITILVFSYQRVTMNYKIAGLMLVWMMFSLEIFWIIIL